MNVAIIPLFSRGARVRVPFDGANLDGSAEMVTGTVRMLDGTGRALVECDEARWGSGWWRLEDVTVLDVRALQVGDSGYLVANQGERLGRVLAVADGRALVRYEMPNGRCFLWDVPERTAWEAMPYVARNMSASRLPKRWRGLGLEDAP